MTCTALATLIDQCDDPCPIQCGRFNDAQAFTNQSACRSSGGAALAEWVLLLHPSSCHSQGELPWLQRYRCLKTGRSVWSQEGLAAAVSAHKGIGQTLHSRAPAGLPLRQVHRLLSTTPHIACTHPSALPAAHAAVSVCLQAGGFAWRGTPLLISSAHRLTDWQAFGSPQSQNPTTRWRRCNTLASPRSHIHESAFGRLEATPISRGKS